MNSTKADDRAHLAVSNAVSVVHELSEKLDAQYVEQIALYERERRLLQGIRKRDAEIASLKHRVKAVSGENDSLRTRLDLLQSVRVMKLQRAYWKLRQKVRGGAARR